MFVHQRDARAPRDPRHAIHRAGVSYLAGIRNFLEDLARRARITDAESFAREWHILMKGSIIAALEGDREAARRGQKLGNMMLRDELDAA